MMNWLEGKDRRVLRYPDDLASTDPEASWKAMRQFLKRYGPYEIIRDLEDLQDMDTLVFRHRRGGPGHVAFWFQKHIVHAGALRVTRTVLPSLTKHSRLVRIYRSKNRLRWLSPSLSSLSA